MSGKPSRRSFNSRLEGMVNKLREEILSGIRQNGEFLPSLNELSHHYQLSKNSVQKGLSILVSESLIERVPSVGIRVNHAGKEEEAVKLRLGYYPSIYPEAELDQLLLEFYAQHPRINVQTLPLMYENYYETVKDCFSNGLLDVVTVNYFNYEQFLYNDDMDNVFEAVKPEQDMYPFLNSAFSKDHNLYVKPFIFSPVILCYNPQHFIDSQIPVPDREWTWDYVIQYSASLKGKDQRYAFYFYPHSDHRWPIFLLQSGISFLRDESGKVRIRETRLMHGLQKCYDLIQTQGIFPAFLSESDADAEELFLQNKVSLIMTTYFNLNRLKNENIHFDIAPLPYLECPKTLLLITGLAINKHSKQKEAAKKLVNFLTSYQSQLHIRQNTLSIPAMKTAAEWEGEERINRPLAFNLYREIIPTYAQLSELQLGHEELAVIRKRLKLFWSGLEDLESACRWLEQNL
jgi:multiple sugar transport system substrate-binding protein